jgi:N-acetylglutamate synthase-like GNAT family acetyltransferase
MAENNTPTNVVDDLLETLYEKYDQYLDEDVFEEGALNFNIDVDDTGKEYISLQNIAIKDEYQNKGIGKEILNEIKKTSDELNIPIVATALDTEPTGFFAKQVV